MPYCHRCGSPGIDTLNCHINGSCRMHFDYNHNRRREEDRQRLISTAPGDPPLEQKEENN